MNKKTNVGDFSDIYSKHIIQYYILSYCGPNSQFNYVVCGIQYKMSIVHHRPDRVQFVANRWQGTTWT